MTTQKAYANYQEVIDFHTESGTSSVIGIHTPCSSRPQRMLRGFWEQFKKFKYLGCDLAVVPAQQLPADPLQVSYEAGEPTSDPRDILNPIMFKGCHGNDLGSILNQFYTGLPDSTLDSSTDPSILDREGSSDSVEQNVVNFGNTVGNDFIEAIYYRALTDNTWLKANPMRGFRRRGLHPMVYALASNVQLAPADSYPANNGILPFSQDYIENDRGSSKVGTFGSGSGATAGTAGTDLKAVAPVTPVKFNTTSLKLSNSFDNSALGFTTYRTVPLGWLDTRQRSGVSVSTSDALNGNAAHDNAIIASFYSTESSVPTLVPKVFMGMLLLSPSYKTEMYYRLILNHHFAFAGFRGVSEMTEESDVNDFGSYKNFES